jgi:N-acetylmuramoyl-L-alanine amidase
VRGLTEAELVLDIALRLEQLLQTKSGIDVVLTRRSDAFVSLEARTAVANRADADVFLSLHANASRDLRANGVESYILNIAPTAAAEAVAARENATSSRNMRHLPELLRVLTQGNKRAESRDLATALQVSVHGQLRRNNREVRNLGVKQAPFMVLLGATMPAALVELSFISNPEEAARLRTEAYRQTLAEGLYAGLLQYQQSVKRAAAIAQR